MAENYQQFIYGIELDHWEEKIVEAEAGWTPHELILLNMSFGDIAQELAIRYNVNIVFQSEALKRERISVLLDGSNSIDELLKFLSASQNATYAVQGSTYVIKPIK
jgi:hypothetical protein